MVGRCQGMKRQVGLLRVVEKAWPSAACAPKYISLNNS